MNPTGEDGDDADDAGDGRALCGEQPAGQTLDRNRAKICFWFMFLGPRLPSNILFVLGKNLSQPSKLNYPEDQ